MKTLNSVANDTRATVPFMEECKPFSLSLPPIRRVVDFPKLTDSISQSESLPGSMECLSPASSGGYVKVEPVIDSTDYTGVEPKARLNRSDDTKEGTEWKTTYGMTKEEKDRLSNMKEEVEEGRERQRIKMESDDGVKYGTSGAAAANGGEGPLCKEEEEELRMQPCPAGDPEKQLQGGLKQEPETIQHRLFNMKEEVEEGPERQSVKMESDDGVKYGTAGAAAANGGEGSLCKEEEEELGMQPCPAGDPEKQLQGGLKQELDGEPLTPGHLLPGSAEGLEVQCAWSKVTRSGKILDMLRQHGGGSEHGGALSNDRFSPRHCRASRRLRSEKNEGPTSHLEQQQNGRPRRPPDGISIEMAFPVSSRRERAGSAPCEQSFYTSAETESHRRIEERKKFVCTCCGKTFPGALELQMHKEQHGTGIWFGCSDCEKRFPNKRYLKIHQRVHIREKPFVCVQCGKRFSQKSSLKTHQRVHTGEKPHSCNECGKSFADLGNLKSHQRIHTGETLHSCDECGKSFGHLWYLKIHQRVHTGEKPHSCDECGKSFAQLCNLKIHQRVHTGEKPHSCDECGKSFVYPHVLKNHQRVHTGEKPHSCHECGKSFADLCNLKTHQSVHTGEKPHSCDECGKSFAHLCHLKIHQRVHTGEKPHSCDECGKSFARLHHLKTHQRVHTGEKPHSCVKCGKSFAYLNVLKNHQSVHTGEKPHRCDECGKSFASLQHLRTHQRVHTGEKPYSCIMCGKSFSQNNYLQKHILTHS